MAARFICAIEGCDKKGTHGGWCSMHYSRWKRHGTFEKTGTANGEPAVFFRNAIRHQTDECIIWPFAKLDAGYGKLGNRLVHRLACEESHGTPPSDRHEAAHTCHNPPCFNGRHLYWATPSQNQCDRVDNGTSNRGGNYRNSKLSLEQVYRIRSMAGVGMFHCDIALEFKISRTVVTRIVNRTRWGWLE